MTPKERITEREKLQQLIDQLKTEYSEAYTWGVRWDERDLTVGYVFEDSRVWVDGEPTDETLCGTCAVQDGHITRLSRFLSYTGRPYIVCGLLSLYGEDQGEVILTECEVMAIP